MADNALLRFKRGSLANLKSQPKVDGTIYVTTDERAMYVDINNNTRIRLGDFIEVDTKNEFDTKYRNPNNIDIIVPEAFYYVKDDNTLYKYIPSALSGELGTWKQVNGGSGGNGSGVSIKDFVGSVISSQNGVSIVSSIQTEDGGQKTLGITYTSTAPDRISLTPGSVSSKPEVVIKVAETDTTGTLTASDNKIILTNTKTGTDASGETVNTDIGNSSVSFTASDDGAVILTSNNTIDIQTKPQSLSTQFYNGVLVSGIRLPSGSNVTSDGTIPAIKVGKNDDAIVIKQFNATPSDNSHITGQLTSGNKSYPAAIVDLPVYTITEVDEQINNKIRVANAMTFKGGRSATIGLPSAEDGVEIGDTYIITSAGMVNGTQAIVGDLFIANSISGEEDENGHISEDDLIWVHVPSGNEDQYQLELNISVPGHALLKGGIGGPNDLIANFSADEGLILETKDDVSGKQVIYKHGAQQASLNEEQLKEYLNPQTPTTAVVGDGTDVNFEAITGLKFDTNGHLTEYTIKKFDLNSIVIKKVESSVKDLQANEHGVEVGTVYYDANNVNRAFSTFKINSSGDSAIQIKTESGAVHIDTVWTEF